VILSDLGKNGDENNEEEEYDRGDSLARRFVNSP